MPTPQRRPTSHRQPRRRHGKCASGPSRAAASRDSRARVRGIHGPSGAGLDYLRDGLFPIDNMQPIPAMSFKVFEQKGYREEERRGQALVEPSELAIADVTGDGKNDIITITHDRIIIYPQD